MANEEHVAALKVGASLWNEWRDYEPIMRPDLFQADLSSMSLIQIDLDNADLREANLRGANLFEAYLRQADLSGADLTWADLREVNLRGANLSRAKVGQTIFGDVDLSQVKGLETVIHEGPSTIGVDTIYRSQGKIPEVFLRGCGIPDEFITFMQSLVTSSQPIQYYSCFISYSDKNRAITERLHNDLQAKGVRCWFAPHDLPIGEPIMRGLDEAIRLHEKVLLILSREAIDSGWVEFEVTQAQSREMREKKTILFPIRVDDAVFEVNTGWARRLCARNIGDFRHWKDHDAYQQAFAHLLHNLKSINGHEISL